MTYQAENGANGAIDFEKYAMRRFGKSIIMIKHPFEEAPELIRCSYEGELSLNGKPEGFGRAQSVVKS